jgi:hypothetical protein
LLVTGCGNQQESAQLREIATQTLAGILGGQEDGIAPVAEQNGFLAVSPQLIATESNTVVGVVLEDRSSQALLTLSGQRGNLVTWLSSDRVSFTLTGGTMLVRTSGLGIDLQNAEFAQVLTVMASGQKGTAQREHVYLTRDFQQERQVFSCDVTPMGGAEIQIAGRNFSTLRFEETCRGDSEQFTNAYWLDGGTGLIVQSIQWIHPHTGRAHFQIISN